MSQMFEYIQLVFEWGDLKELNGLSQAGFRVVHVEDYQVDVDSRIRVWKRIALLEREIK